VALLDIMSVELLIIEIHLSPTPLLIGEGLGRGKDGIMGN
jgi:hypothetical protein